MSVFGSSGLLLTRSGHPSLELNIIGKTAHFTLDELRVP